MYSAEVLSGERGRIGGHSHCSLPQRENQRQVLHRASLLFLPSVCAGQGLIRVTDHK